MEAIRISCAGYPTRKTFDEFVDRFSLLAPEALDGRYQTCPFFLLVIIVIIPKHAYFFHILIMLVLMRSLLASGF